MYRHTQRLAVEICGLESLISREREIKRRARGFVDVELSGYH